MFSGPTYLLPIYRKDKSIAFHLTIPDDLFTRSLVIPLRWSEQAIGSGYACSRRVPAGKKLYLHRIIYVIYHGPIPEGCEVDHADRNRKNNMPDNLRAVTHGANIVNSGRKDRSGYRGVRNMEGRWQARITREGKTHYLGCYDTKEEAFAERQKAEKEHYPELHK